MQSGALAGDPLFVGHVIHVLRGVALELTQAIDRAEIERFRMIVVAGSRVRDADFHFADRIDGHDRSSFYCDTKTGGNVSRKSIQQLALSKRLFVKPRARDPYDCPKCQVMDDPE